MMTSNKSHPRHDDRSQASITRTSLQARQAHACELGGTRHNRMKRAQIS